MSENSKRESILLEAITTLGDLTWPKTIKRQKLSIEQLKDLATTQLPYIGVIGTLPDPRPNPRSDRKVPDTFISDLEITMICYGLDNENPDATISNYYDDLWRVLLSKEYSRPLGVVGVRIVPATQQAMWHPYFAFALKYIVTYSHTKGGI